MEHMRGVERMGLVKSFAYRRPRYTFPLELTLGIFKRFKLLEPWQKRDYILEVDLNDMDDMILMRIFWVTLWLLLKMLAQMMRVLMA